MPRPPLKTWTCLCNEFSEQWAQGPWNPPPETSRKDAGQQRLFGYSGSVTVCAEQGTGNLPGQQAERYRCQAGGCCHLLPLLLAPFIFRSYFSVHLHACNDREKAQAEEEREEWGEHCRIILMGKKKDKRQRAVPEVEAAFLLETDWWGETSSGRGGGEPLLFLARTHACRWTGRTPLHDPLHHHGQGVIVAVTVPCCC